MDYDTRYPVECGAMIAVPIYENHRRGKNWLAIIEADPQSPGGLRRTFVQRGRGQYYYLIDQLKPGIPVEFGADYYSGSGKKSSNRVYGIVVTVAGTFIEFEWHNTAIQAIKAGKIFTGEEGNPFLQYQDSELIEELTRRGYTITKEESYAN